MKIGVIADDFTGGSDIALTLAEAGMPVVLYAGVPGTPADPHLGAGVVALKSRTAPVEEAVEQSLAACDWLLAQGATQIILKVCSTFDSTPAGNIGPVLDALAKRLGTEMSIVCPAFPENGRSVYQGHLFVGDRLLNESGMEDHPLTPMTDPDLRRVLAAQSEHPVDHVPAAVVLAGGEAIAAALSQKAHYIVDAISDADLMEIGRAAKSVRLLSGGSGIAKGLPANFNYQTGRPSWQAIRGPGVVLSGSCSRATQAQVAEYRKSAPAMKIEVEEAVNGAVDLAAIADWVITQDRPPLIYSSADADEVRAAQEAFGGAVAAAAIENVFSQLAFEMSARGLVRLVVAGGETSGAVVAGLGAHELTIGPRAAAGVPLVRHAGMALALKSGNFGGPKFFSETLAAMEADG
ncbi:four-carbon acid sugar kinase family protein [Rhodobacteraceae bacterium D3-12]|nr:four-carbon acid sugar kinase family protein [Rhodobacteraceae bacterium D3-12]